MQLLSRRLFLTLFAATIVSIIALAIYSPASVTAQSAADYTLVYQLDDSNVPPLTYKDLTVQIDVGTITSATVFVDGATIAHTYNAATGILQFTTDGSSIEIGLTDVADAAAIGPLQATTLKEDKKWAWSIGFDDNTFLKDAISVVESYGYSGTIFQIAQYIDDNRIEGWIIDKPDMHTYLANGWSLGNHTWDHPCYQSGDRTATILDGYNRIAQIAADSSVPDYKVISFAAPCFDTPYHQYILNMRNAGTTAVQFNESGSSYPLVVDASQTADFTLNNRTVYAFDFDDPIARDPRIEYDVPAAIAEIDWIANNASATRHFWHNSLAHGSKEANVQQLVDHIYSNYGAGGTDEVWVAPSDQIYSYLLVRENSTLTLIDSYADTPPSAQPPGQVTQIGPDDSTIPAGVAEFSWQVEPAATDYQLVVYRVSPGTVDLLQTYSASTICNSTTCAVTPTSAQLSLVAGEYTWLVRAKNANGFGPWSNYQP